MLYTYIVPIYNGHTADIECIKARSLAHAEELFIDNFILKNEDIPADFEEFKNRLEEEGWSIGEFYELSELN